MAVRLSAGDRAMAITFRLDEDLQGPSARGVDPSGAGHAADPPYPRPQRHGHDARPCAWRGAFDARGPGRHRWPLLPRQDWSRQRWP